MGKHPRMERAKRAARAVAHPPSDLPEPERAWNLLRDALLPGAVAGTLGALSMALLAGALSGVFLGDPWRPFHLVAGLFFRAQGGSGLVGALVGVLVHFAVAGGVATGFAVLLPRGGTAVAALGFAALYVLALWPVMALLVLPFASPPLARADRGGTLLLLHLVFGAWLATVPALRRTFTRLDTARHGYAELKAAVG